MNQHSPEFYLETGQQRAASLKALFRRGRRDTGLRPVQLFKCCIKSEVALIVLYQHTF